MTKRNFRSLVVIAAVLSMALSTMVLPVSAVDQPFMKAAREDLNKAQKALKKAVADKGGHRAKAMMLVTQAISQVNQGIEFDRKHNAEMPDILNDAIADSADQPYMVEARSHLQDALANLQKAAENKGGFRAAAMETVNNAINEVNAGIDYAKNH